MDTILYYIKTKDILIWGRSGVLFLGIAGLYSIILVILRTPILYQLIKDTNIFSSALVVHVNLSVLVWFISIACIVWQPPKIANQINYDYFNKLCNIGAVSGALIISTAPIFGKTIVVMSNYIPMLDNLVFVLGLSVFAASVLIFACCNLLLYIISLRHISCCKSYFVHIASLSSIIIFIVSWLCFLLSYLNVQRVTNQIMYNKKAVVDLHTYYELLFWSGGHCLQFVYTQMVILIWLVFAELLLDKTIKYLKIYTTCLYINLFCAVLLLVPHFMYDTIDWEFKVFYTNHMKYCGGIAPFLSVFCMIYEIYIQKIKNFRKKEHIFASFLCSILLFGTGGIIGILISGANVTIPAHYHGSIVGITIAYMGFLYLLYFKEGNIKYPSWQIYITTVGQILHIGGLAVAGGYGALRKTPGVEAGFKIKFAMGVMGLGGIMAIIGGIIFVALLLRQFLKQI